MGIIACVSADHAPLVSEVQTLCGVVVSWKSQSKETKSLFIDKSILETVLDWIHLRSYKPTRQALLSSCLHFVIIVTLEPRPFRQS